MANEEAEEIMNFYNNRDSRQERQNFISRMERKMHRKERLSGRS